MPRRGPLVLVLQPGKKYRVTWKAPHQKLMRTFVGVFVSSSEGGRVVFDTKELNVAWIVQCTILDDRSSETSQNS